jgi:pimeloyl-ACP methyl ester carboxylesterase
MHFTPSIRACLLAIVALSLTACAPFQMYRDDLRLCTNAKPADKCTSHTLQDYIDPDAPDAAYTLGFIEFDDQGELWSRKQMWAVLNLANKRAAFEDLLIMVFVHGWKHSAAPGDANIITFREALREQSRLESALARKAGVSPRRVMGVYLGWRGGSITAPLAKELTFWDRKNTAHKVGTGDVAEVLGRLEEIKRVKDNQAGGKDRGNTRLVVIGHSFGGAVVFTALSKILTDRFVRTVGPEGAVTDAEGFGDLVVLLNPAFEAQLASGLSDMANERRRYFASQLPVMAILTSTGDEATKTAFPIGRWFSTFWEKTRDVKRHNPVSGDDLIIEQKQANRQAVGHFAPYRTHDLKPVAVSESQPAGVQEMRQYVVSSQQWENDKPGSVIDFVGSQLIRTSDSAGRNPYLFVRVDQEMMHNHNHIDDPRLIAFVRQIIQLTSQDPNLDVRAKMRSQVMEQPPGDWHGAAGQGAFRK